MMKFRRPRAIAFALITLATLLSLSLGGWQLQRLVWKQGVIAQIEQAQAAEVLGNLPPSLEGLDYRNVILTGTFLHEKHFKLIGRQQGTSVGYFIVTPFVLEDDGRIILINRGFAPPDRESKPEGVQTVRGVIRPARAHRLFAPDNHPEKNVWFYEDIAAMETASGLTLSPLVVEATGKEEAGAFPIPNTGEISIRNDHLGYAITWFLLAAIGVIMFAIYHRKL